MKHYLSVWKNRNLSWLTIADALSMLGDQIGWVALLWFATTVTNHPDAVGMIGLVFGLPGILIGPIAGHILDKVSNKTVLLITNLLLGGIFIAIPLMNLLYGISLPVLYLFVFFAGCLVPFTNVGWMVIVPKLVSENELPLINTIVEIIWNGSMLVGPFLGGIAIAAWGAIPSILIDGLSFWIAAVCVLFLRTKDIKTHDMTQSVPLPKQAFWRSVFTSFRILFGMKIVWWITIAAFLLTMATGQLEVSLPLFTHRELGLNAFVLGSFWATYFLGSIIGSALSGIIFKHWHVGILMSLMVIGWGISFIPMIWFHSLAVTYACLALSGLLFSGYPPLARTTVQRVTPKELLGRIMGIRGSFIACGPPLGAYLSGGLGTWFHSSVIMGYTGVGIFGFGLFLLFQHDFRSLAVTK